MKNLLDIFFDMRYTSLRQGVLAQLGEHLPYKQRVIGLPCRFDSGLRHLREKGISVFTEIPFFVTLYTEDKK